MVKYVKNVYVIFIMRIVINDTKFLNDIKWYNTKNK